MLIEMPSTTPAHPLATAAALAEYECHEVVGGAIVKKAAPSGEHGMTQGDLFDALTAFRGYGGGPRIGGWWIGLEIEIELQRHEVYLPDLAGWRMERIPERPHGRPVRDVPDWVCEVLSPSTASRDLGAKQRIYHRAGIKSYWVADPAAQVLSVMRWHEAGYMLALAAGPDDIVRAEPFDAIELAVADIFGLARR